MKKVLTMLAMLTVVAAPACAQPDKPASPSAPATPATPAASAPAAEPAPAGDRGKAETTVNGKKISIDYGRPELKGHDLVKEAPVGFVWRLGKDGATEIETTGDLDVAGTTVKAGKYSLWAKHVAENEWHLCFSPKTGIWGAPEVKDGYVAELPLTLSKVDKSAELVAIALSDAGGNKAKIQIDWGTLQLTGEMGVK